MADAIQRQHLLIRIRAGDRADRQHHMELPCTIGVCTDVPIDVLVGQRPVAALRQELVGITACNRSVLTVKLCGSGSTHSLQESRFIHMHYLQQIRCGELLAGGDVIQIDVIAVYRMFSY